MKKTLVSLAVASAVAMPVVAQADATLYGLGEFRLIDRDGSDLDATMAKARLGVKGSVDNDVKGLESFYQLEWEYEADGAFNSTESGETKVRKALVGLKGNWGQATFGRQNNPLQQAEDAIDIFGNDSLAFERIGDRVGNSVSYITPTVAGFEAFGVAVLDGQTDDGTDRVNTKDGDAYIYGLTYRGLPGLDLTAGVQDNRTTDALGVDNGSKIKVIGGTYAIADFTLGGLYETEKFDEVSEEKIETWSARGSYQLGNVGFHLAYSDIDDNGQGDNVGEHSMAMIDYALGKQATTYLQYSGYSSSTVLDGTRQRDAVTVGYIVKF